MTPAAKTGFAQVLIKAPPPSAPTMIEVVLTNGRILRLLGAVDAVQLRAVVEALEAC